MSEKSCLTTTAGVRMPRILYGTAWKKERTADLVEQALHAGFRGIDTAGQPKHYDECLVGVGLQRAQAQGVARESLYLQTKYTPLSSQAPQQLPYDASAAVAEQVLQSFASSQQNLHTDYVDCLILHSPLASHEETMEAWHALESIQASGGARQLGISNCYDLDVMKALYADALVKPTIVQNRFYKDTNYEIDMRLWCAEQEIIFESFWSLTANAHILKSEMVQGLADKYHKSPAQIFFRYLTHLNIVPLTGTTSVQHMQEDLSIFDFGLDAAELKYLDALLS